jgi:hypothetical protein
MLNVVRKPVCTNARTVRISGVKFGNFNVRQLHDSIEIRFVGKSNRRLHFVLFETTNLPYVDLHTTRHHEICRAGKYINIATARHLNL